jgi:hypothetical protein
MRGIRRRDSARPSRALLRRTCVATILALLAMGIAASSALGGIQQEFAIFKGCPVDTPGVVQCLVSNTESGEFKIGSKDVTVDRTITLEGAISETTSELVGAKLSKTPLVVPGGLVGIELDGITEVTATAELAGPVQLSLDNLGTDKPALSMPLKVKLSNPALGEACYIGSNAEPVTLNLTSGTTNPPPPNKPITGSVGTFTLKDHSTLIIDSGSSLVDNAFAAPGVNGCGGLLALAVDPVVDLDAGLPAPAGSNTAILTGTLYSASARVVKAVALLPEIGRCTKVVPEKVGKEKFFHGHYEAAGCVEENPQPPGSQNGEWEWTPGPGPIKTFTATAGKLKLETVGKAVINCVAATGAGEYTGTKTATASLKLTGCQRADTKASCQSAGAAAGEIVTSQLEGELGFIEDEYEGEQLNVSVGLDLKRQPSLLTAECGGSPVSVSGSVIAPIGPVDKMASSFTLKFKATGGKQIPEAFEEKPNDTLVSTIGGGPPEQTGLTGTGKLTNGEKLEIRAATQ